MLKQEFREVFIFVAGATPQIITETIYAFSQKNPQVHPDEIYIITTSTGKKRIKETLIEKGILKALNDEYSLPALELKEDSFIVVKDSSGQELDDIRNEAENEALGDCITSLIMEKARDKSIRLHCSLAGGRKTMSFYIGSALQLFGRPWDRLYHVLVSSDFETNPHFFYKPKKNTVIERRCADGSIKQLNTDNAEIQLAELPLIRLGNKLSLKGKGFRELISEGQREWDTATIQPELTVDLFARTIYIGETLIEMVPVQLMIYAAFLRQKLEHCKYPDSPYCLECTDCFFVLSDLASKPALEAMAKDYDKIYGGKPLKGEELSSKWKEGIKPEVLRGNISKINRTIKEQIHDEKLLPYYQVATVKKYADSRYGVRIEKGKISIDN